MVGRDDALSLALALTPTLPLPLPLPLPRSGGLELGGVDQLQSLEPLFGEPALL